MRHHHRHHYVYHDYQQGDQKSNHLARMENIGEVEALACSQLATKEVALTALVFTPLC